MDRHMDIIDSFGLIDLQVLTALEWMSGRSAHDDEIEGDSKLGTDAI
jgi:hypothetical protein